MPQSSIRTLPKPALESGLTVKQALERRRSVRDYRDTPISLQELSELLWAGQGVTGRGRFRTAPSAGALYPLELLAVIGNVEDLPPGLYRYLPMDHGLALLAEGDIREALYAAALRQSCVLRGAASLALTAVYERVTRTYGERGVRYVDMEAGHAAQNILLQAESLGMGAVVLGAFRDAEVKRVLLLAREEVPLYILPVGRK
jgi:SagB-type dehydrogenase family enzyme